MSTGPANVRQAVFVDTSAHYALVDTKDTNHQSARAIGRQLATQHTRLVTTNFILAETHALLLSRVGRPAALAFLDRIDRSSFTLVRISEADEREARNIIGRYNDKDFSLTDATSFSVMERLGLSVAFCFDRNFAQYGVTVLVATQP
ncbi:MAG: PIN domain-containing protein [Chloroflexota bacterium]|nr:PIN domain-containing protein [Chloroflexota bacterium]